MIRLQPTGVNAPQIEYWNGPAGDKWARMADSQDRLLEALGTAAMDACDIRPGHRVLDTGCGSGTTTIEIARRVGPQGRVLGVDISTPMLDIARARTAERGIETIAFENRDVATYPFEPASLERVYSRFGVMFFIDPVAAFANIRSGVVAGGRLAFVCWRALEYSAWQNVPYRIALRHLPPPPQPGPDDPGPQSFADADRVRRILGEAGYRSVAIDPMDSDVTFETDAAGAAERLVQLGPTGRMLTSQPKEMRHRVRDELADALAPYQTEAGVTLGAAVWIVTATAP